MTAAVLNRSLSCFTKLVPSHDKSQKRCKTKGRVLVQKGSFGLLEDLYPQRSHRQAAGFKLVPWCWRQLLICSLHQLKRGGMVVLPWRQAVLQNRPDSRGAPWHLGNHQAPGTPPYPPTNLGWQNTHKPPGSTRHFNHTCRFWCRLQVSGSRNRQGAN